MEAAAAAAAAAAAPSHSLPVHRYLQLPPVLGPARGDGTGAACVAGGGGRVGGAGGGLDRLATGGGEEDFDDIAFDGHGINLAYRLSSRLSELVGFRARRELV